MAARMLLLALLISAGDAQSLRGQDAPDAFAAFDAWWQQYSSAQASDRPGLTRKGIATAKMRRNAMLQLIETDPATAIGKAFFEEYHSALPKTLQDLVETHVRGLASLIVTTNKEGRVQRRVKMEGQTWQAFLYGERLNLISREEIPIHGVALADHLAVDGSPLERFPERETLLEVLKQGDGKRICPIGGEPGTIPGAVGDALLWFDTQEHLRTVEKALIEKEVSPENEE